MKRELFIISKSRFQIAVAILILQTGQTLFVGQSLAQEATSAPAARPAPAADFDSTLKSLDETMTRQQIEALIRKANDNRLKTERQLVAAEIKNTLSDPDDVDKALAILGKSPANTQADNIERICLACARIDTKLARLYDLYNQKKFAEAAQSVRMPPVAESTFLSAARAYIYARCLEEAARADDAADAYSQLIRDMYDRISFACDSAIRLGRLYDKSGRGMKAMQAYVLALKNYGLTMEQEQFDEIYARTKKLAELYADPLGSAARLMGNVKERLNLIDSGPKVQQEQQQIVALLDDLIKTAQEQENQSGQDQSQGRKGRKEKEPNTEKGKAPGKSDRPSNPALRSVLRTGDTSRAGRLSQVHEGPESGEWSKLPPQEQERLQQLRQKMLSERYRDAISDYHKKIAQEK